ncbi:MAG: ABC transporter permease [Acidobacteriia bacterium]|nr:ABC transporter permease [Terriglobia bacterium]
MLRFWQNPEFIRHVRAELRPARVLSAVVITYIVIALIGMGIFNRSDPARELYRGFFGFIVSIASGLLVLWCLSVGSQAVAGERELKTFDFLRTTRLSAGELLVGKLLGSPVLAYVIYACALVVIIPVGVAAGFSMEGLLLTTLLVVCLALLVGLFGIWLSMLVEKMNRGAGVLLLFILYPFVVMGMVYDNGGAFPGFACLSPFPAILWALGERTSFTRTGAVPVFGVQLPYAIVTLALYFSLGAWFVLMIVRNFKRDIEEIRLLSRWQAIGFAFYINILFYAFLDLHQVLRQSDGASMITVMGLLLTGSTTALVGLATLSPPERLKIWERQRVAGTEGYLSEDGLPWPWMVVTAAMGFAMLVVQAVAVGGAGSASGFDLPHAAVGALLLLAFAMRDVLFLQWCKLTRMKSPVTKGVLLLMLYYFAAAIVLTVAFSVSQKEGMFAARVLTPLFLFEDKERAAAAAGMMTGVATQGAVIAVLLGAIATRLRRTLLVAQA